jgi:hypothetical protein
MEKSTNGPWAALRLPGVALKTEYSSANRGVQPDELSKDPELVSGVAYMLVEKKNLIH